MLGMINVQRWTVVFKALSNINRLKIISLLSTKKSVNVGDIADALKISVTATSNHLVLLQKLEVLEAEGKEGHVFYSLNSHMPQEFVRPIKLFS